MKSKCERCGKEIESKYSEKEKLHYFYCPDCQLGAKEKTEAAAKKAFSKITADARDSMAIAIIDPPKKSAELPAWVEKNMPMLIDGSARFIDKPATRRMINKNIKYAMSLDLKDVWTTPEGQASIMDAIVESFWYGATLPDMGAIVPFGKYATFIPAVAAFEHALTSGNNPPFSDIAIDGIFENDQYEMSRGMDGSFSFSMTRIGLPRGEIIGVVVRAFDNDRKIIIGEAYDAERLLEKAKRHSKSYQYYLSDMQKLTEAQSEGKDFIEKFNRKFYEKDIVNPYDGPDRPEMLRKVAGKTFFRKFMMVRNAQAVESEWAGEDEETIDATIDRVMSAALDTVSAPIKDAEIVTEEPKKAGSGKQQSTSEEKTDKKLYDEEEGL